MSNIAVFPGSFDPITKGHVNIIERALPLFDKIIIAIGKNSNKKYMYDSDKRKEWIINSFKGNNKIEVDEYDGLTVDYCKKVNANFILRGLRTSADFEFERAIAHTNHKLNPKVDTVFILSSEEYSSISSSIVREVASHGGDVSMLIGRGVDLS
ncbi:MAG: pantetheine-phosphate adenylyltransferase [Bacteroidia bacterium]|nr:pantetheine-phosphate adenylyltransferase [Bacteroidia bacterium]NNC86510.1 pantetheine-phosphate adenylyltransferase [Bacteroidia bacterium]